MRSKRPANAATSSLTRAKCTSTSPGGERERVPERERGGQDGLRWPANGVCARPVAEGPETHNKKLPAPPSTTERGEESRRSAAGKLPRKFERQPTNSHALAVTLGRWLADAALIGCYISYPPCDWPPCPEIGRRRWGSAAFYGSRRTQQPSHACGSEALKQAGRHNSALTLSRISRVCPSLCLGRPGRYDQAQEPRNHRGPRRTPWLSHWRPTLPTTDTTDPTALHSRARRDCRRRRRCSSSSSSRKAAAHSSSMHLTLQRTNIF